MKKVFTVFLCFTYRNLCFVISFNWKNNQRSAAHLFCFYIQKLSLVFLCFTIRNWRSVISFNWKSDQWNAAHLFWFYIQKLSPVFLCFTIRNWRSVISFNWKHDKWNAAHLFFFLYPKALSSISMFYPSKLAFCNFIQLEKWSVECGASFLFLYPKRSLAYFYVLPFEICIL